MAIVIAGNMGETRGEWWNTSWGYCRDITMDSGMVDSTLSNFPMLILLNDSRIDYANTKDAGEDLRIVNASCGDGGDIVDYEIAIWNESGAYSEVYFLVASLDSGSDTTYSYYYGNAGADDSQDASGLWDTAGYEIVLHFTETNPDDSTSNGYDFTDSGSPTFVYSCNTGNCVNYDTGDYTYNSNPSNTEAASATVDIWVNSGTEFNSDGNFRWFSEEHGGDGFNFLYHTDGKIEHNWRDDNSWKGPVQYTTTLAANTWHYMGFVQDESDDAARGEIFIDGESKATAPGTADMGSGTRTTAHSIAADSSGNNKLNAMVDEYRYSNIARSDDWMMTTEHTMRGEIVTYGGEEERSTCIYSSGNWIIDCSESCKIESETDAGGNDVIFTGAGEIMVLASVSNIGNTILSDGCTITLGSGIGWRL